LGDVLGDVAHNAGLAVFFGFAGHTDVENHDAFFDLVFGDHAGVASGGDDDVGLADQLIHVGGTGVGSDHGGVDVTTGEQQGRRTANGNPAANNQHGFAFGVDVVATQQGQATLGRAWQRPGDLATGVGYQTAKVQRVQTVGVLTRIDGLQNGIGVDLFWQRQLHDVAGAFRVVIQLVDDIQDFFLGR